MLTLSRAAPAKLRQQWVVKHSEIDIQFRLFGHRVTRVFRIPLSDQFIARLTDVPVVGDRAAK